MRVGLGISIAACADAKLAVEFRFCYLKFSNRCWNLIRPPVSRAQQALEYELPHDRPGKYRRGWLEADDALLSPV